MSYSRRFRRQIAVPYSGSETVSYPASERGGTTTVYYRGTAYEDVEVDIEVDTRSFDSSVADCNDDVNGLTASVCTLNTAQCVAIAENAERVSKTIIDGFFNTVRTDLSTQKVELQQAVESRLILLRQQAESLKEKQKLMADDYARTTARYQKVFNDLNNELEIRIHEIDQPVFKFVKEIDEQSDRMLHTDMVQTAVTLSKESGILQAQITAATVKHHALQAMEKAQTFLTAKAISESTIRNTSYDGAGTDRYFIPVCYLETESEGHHVERKCVVSKFFSMQNSDLEKTVSERIDGSDMDFSDSINNEQLKSYIQTEIDNNITNLDEHHNRVREMINRMLNK